jgi:hypothetical protein
MKKRMVVLLLVMIMISGLCVNAMATERASQIKPKLSFSGKTANCSVTVVEVGKLDVTLELWNGSEMVDSWSDSGTNYLNVSGSHAAVSGTTYTLIAHGTIGSSSFRECPTGRCYVCTILSALRSSNVITTLFLRHHLIAVYKVCYQ